MVNSFIEAFLGGMLIGAGAILLMLTNGRIAGISGIVSGALSIFSFEQVWRWSFIVGLIAAPILTGLIGFTLPDRLATDELTLMIAGVLVGVGTHIGSGCTSGHGICGIGRLSTRSLVATVTFMLTAMLTLFITKYML